MQGDRPSPVRRALNVASALAGLTHAGCFHEFGVHFAGLLVIRASLFGVHIGLGPLIFGNSHLYINTQLYVYVYTTVLK